MLLNFRTDTFVKKIQKTKVCLKWFLQTILKIIYAIRMCFTKMMKLNKTDYIFVIENKNYSIIA